MPGFQGTYILNPQYKLRSDRKRVLFFYKNADPPKGEGISDFIDFLHPLLAVLLSLFDGEKDVATIAENFSFLSGLDRATVDGLLSRLLENKTEIKVDFGGHSFYFPLNTLVPVDTGGPVIHYDPEDFLIPGGQLDFKSQRLYVPLDAMLMLNNICVSRCVYCYVDKRVPRPCRIPFERVADLVKEAAELGLRSFNPTGGELFTYRYWKELLKSLVDHHFDPYITTKYPLDERRVSQLKDTGIKRINLSIDTVDRDQMTRLLKVDGRYYDLVLNTLAYLDKHHFDICIHSQVTSVNQDSMADLFRYLLGFENVTCIKVRATAFSRFAGEGENGDNAFSRLRPDKKKLASIKEMVFRLREEHRGRVDFSFHDSPGREAYINPFPEEKQRLFKNRAQCSGNFHSFYILPDGKVTICEELYWLPQFIIGDVLKQSIREIWNSEQALALYRFSRERVSPQSACRGCDDFDSCHSRRGVCWKQVIYAYGEENWDYPDPRCPKAPVPRNEFWIE